MLVVRHSRLLRIVKEYAGLIVGSILGIPAIVILCYFIYLKRLKRYTDTLDVHFSFFPPAAGPCFSYTFRLGLKVVVLGPDFNRWCRLAEIEFEFYKVLQIDVT